MATSARYRMLPLEERDVGPTEDPFATYGRTAWTLTLHISRLSTAPAGDFQLLVEEAPQDDLGFQTANDFGVIDAAAITAEASPRVVELTVPQTERWIRARVAAFTGTYTAELVAVSPFLDPDLPADQQRLTQVVRDFDEGRSRIVEQAETDVLQRIGRDQWGRLLNLNVGISDLLEQIQDAIALQASWVFQRESLAKGDAADHQALDDMKRYHPDLDHRLSPLMLGDRALLIWQGR